MKFMFDLFWFTLMQYFLMIFLPGTLMCLIVEGGLIKWVGGKIWQFFWKIFETLPMEGVKHVLNCLSWSTMYETIVKTHQMFLFFHLFDLKDHNLVLKNPKIGKQPPSTIRHMRVPSSSSSKPSPIPNKIAFRTSLNAAMLIAIL